MTNKSVKFGLNHYIYKTTATGKYSEVEECIKVAVEDAKQGWRKSMNILRRSYDKKIVELEQQLKEAKGNK